MLRHSTTRKVRVLPEDFIDLLLHPDRFLSLSNYVESIVRSEKGQYDVVFRWVKWGMTRRYWVKLRVFRDGNTVIYESTPDSDHPMRLVFTVVKDPDGYITLSAYAEMDAGTLARLLGKGDFAKFIDSLIDTAIKESLRRFMEGGEAKVVCNGCAFYEVTRKYCYALNRAVGNPSEPPCGGRLFKPVAEGPGRQESSKPSK